jgi:hypothetical protein
MVILAVAAAASCGNGAVVGGPQGTLAVGAYFPLGYGDDCATQNGKLPPLCISHYVTELLELSSSDPSVAEVVAGQDVPSGAVAALYPNYVLGKGHGQATLKFKARFNDGSVRQASTTVRVASPDSLSMIAVCDDGSSVTNLLAGLGAQEQFSLLIYASTEELVGWLPDAVTADGVTQVYDDWGNNPYVWQVPATPAVLQLQSAIVAKVTGTLTAFGPEQVTDIALRPSSDTYRDAFTAPGDFTVSHTVLVNGQPICRPLPVELHAMTPAVCSEPAVSVAWSGDKYGTPATAHAEGLCTVGVSMPDLPVIATHGFPIFFVTAPPAGLEGLTTTDPCPVEGETACQYGYGQVGLCKSSHWVFQPLCPADQVCDFVPDTTAGCVAGTVCAKCRGLR